MSAEADLTRTAKRGLSLDQGKVIALRDIRPGVAAIWGRVGVCQEETKATRKAS